MNPPIRRALRAVSAVAPGLAAWLAGRLWFRLPAPRVSDEGKAFLATGDRFTVAVNGRRVVARRWGAGPAVILTHGWGGSPAQFQSIAEALVRRGMQAVAFDSLSHGESEAGALGARYSTLLEFAESLREVGRVTPEISGIVAHSGGCMATAWALERDQSWTVPRLVFIAPFAKVPDYMKAFQQAFGLSDEAVRRFMSRAEDRFGFRWKDLDVPAMAGRMRTPPVLVIHDREDRETRWQDGADIAAAWPDATFVSTTGLGHNRILRDPAVVDAIAGFF